MTAKVATVITRLATAEWSPECEVSPGKRTSASETSGTEGWLMSACAAEARSAPKLTRDGLDSGGKGPGMLYLESPAILRWHAVPFLFRRAPILQRGRPFQGSPYHMTVPEIEAHRVAPVRTFRYRPLPVDVIRPSPRHL